MTSVFNTKTKLHSLQMTASRTEKSKVKDVLFLQHNILQNISVILMV